MAKVYVKKTWADEVLSGSARYRIADNGGTVIHDDVQISLKTGVVQAGDPVDATNLNHIENGIEALETKLDALKLDDLATPDDNTDLDASTTRHGLMPKLDDNAEHFFNGKGQQVALPGGGSCAIEIILGDGSNVLTTGFKGFIEAPFDFTIEAVTLVADVSGSCVIDIWKDTYANFPPTVADTITASAKPTLSSAQKSQNTTLTGWTKTVTKGDILGFNVDSASTVKQITISIRGKKA